MMSSGGNVQKGMGGGIAIGDSTDPLFDGTAFGWAWLFHDYKNFLGGWSRNGDDAITPTTLINSASADINKWAIALTP